jgi:uncharacterized membrane protein YvbJ
MICKYCGQELKDGQKFCTKCGMPQNTMNEYEKTFIGESPQANTNNSQGMPAANTGVLENNIVTGNPVNEIISNNENEKNF